MWVIDLGNERLVKMLKEILNRRSVRKYENKSVEEEKLTEILESCRIAPSGSNTQPWRLIVVKSDEMRNKIAEVAHKQTWMTQAPVHIVCVADSICRLDASDLIKIDENTSEFMVKQLVRDTTIGAAYMTLQAEALGLGTCWVAWFEQKDIRPLLGIPEDKFVVCILTVGYPAEKPKQRPRMSLEEIVRYEHW